MRADGPRAFNSGPKIPIGSDPVNAAFSCSIRRYNLLHLQGFLDRVPDVAWLWLRIRRIWHRC